MLPVSKIKGSKWSTSLGKVSIIRIYEPWSESASARPFKSVLGEETSTWANKGLHWAFDHVRQSGFSLQRVEFHKGCSPKVSYYTKSCWWVVAFFKSSRYLKIPPCRVSPVLIWASSTPPTYHIFICKIKNTWESGLLLWPWLLLSYGILQ